MRTLQEWKCNAPDEAQRPSSRPQAPFAAEAQGVRSGSGGRVRGRKIRDRRSSQVGGGDGRGDGVWRASQGVGWDGGREEGDVCTGRAGVKGVTGWAWLTGDWHASGRNRDVVEDKRLNGEEERRRQTADSGQKKSNER